MRPVIGITSREGLQAQWSMAVLPMNTGMTKSGLKSREDREARLTWELFNGGTSSAESILAWLGLAWWRSWVILRMPQPSECANSAGDIDVLAGQMVFDELRLCWRPSYSYLAGLEVKCAYVDLARTSAGDSIGRIQSDKSGAGKARRLKGQLKQLQHLGLDRVGLLDLSEGIDAPGADLITCAGVSGAAVDEGHRRAGAHAAVELPAGVGHFCVTIGTLHGHSIQGIGHEGFRVVRNAIENPFRDDPDVCARRCQLVDSLTSLLADSGVVAGSEPCPSTVLDVCPHCRGLGRYHARGDCL